MGLRRLTRSGKDPYPFAKAGIPATCQKIDYFIFTNTQITLIVFGKITNDMR